MGFLDKKLNDMPFGSKMITIYYICILIPITLLAILFAYFLFNQIEMQYKTDVKSAFSSANHEIESYFNNGITIADQLYTNKTVVYKIFTDDSETNQAKRYNNTVAIDSYISSLKVLSDCKQILIYTNSDNINEGVYVRKINQYLKNEKWYIKYISPGHKKSFMLFRDRDGTATISYFIKLDYSNSNCNSFIKIDFELNKLAEIINRHCPYNPVILSDENDNIIFSTSNEDDMSKNDISFDLTMPADWKLSTSYTMSGFSFELTRTLILFVIMYLALIGIATSAIFYISNNYKKRINTLTHVINLSTNEIFEKIDESFVSKDELGILANGINNAFAKINYLINEVYKVKIKNIEIELENEKNKLRALYNQINPHFLFNIMETLRMKSLMKGERETATVLKNLSKFYRNSLSWSDLLIPLEKEIEFVKEYMSIQEYRFGDSLEYNIELDSSARLFKVPKMTIQIFVENSCTHGFAGKTGKKTLNISIRNEDDILTIIIIDNGCGIEQSVIDDIENNTLINDNTHLGISNIKQRLSFYYKNKSTVKLENINGQGTKIIIEIRGESC